MVFDLTKTYVPESYTESRDYRTFLRQLGMLITVLKYNIDHFPDLYNADECPDHLLPLLATMVGYKYKESKDIGGNRKVIKYFPYLIRNRGSETGIKLAVALSINTDPATTKTYLMDNIIIEPNIEVGVITIYYPRTDVLDWELIEAVRPVGMRVHLVKSDLALLTEELDVQTTVHIKRHHEYFDESIIGKSQVGFNVNTITRNEDKEET